MTQAAATTKQPPALELYEMTLERAGECWEAVHEGDSLPGETDAERYRRQMGGKLPCELTGQTIEQSQAGAERWAESETRRWKPNDEAELCHDTIGMHRYYAYWDYFCFVHGLSDFKFDVPKQDMEIQIRGALYAFGDNCTHVAMARALVIACLSFVRDHQDSEAECEARVLTPSPGISDEQLMQHFAAYSPVCVGSSNTTASMRFANKEAAREAIRCLDGSVIGGQQIKVRAVTTLKLHPADEAMDCLDRLLPWARKVQFYQHLQTGFTIVKGSDSHQEMTQRLAEAARNLWEAQVDQYFSAAPSVSAASREIDAKRVARILADLENAAKKKKQKSRQNNKKPGRQPTSSTPASSSSDASSPSPVPRDVLEEEEEEVAGDTPTTVTRAEWMTARHKAELRVYLLQLYPRDTKKKHNQRLRAAIHRLGRHVQGADDEEPRAAAV